jgi:IS5 family transposase
MSCYVQSRIEGARGDGMIEMRRAQLSFGDGLIAEEVSDLREDWMEYADQVLADEAIVAAVYEALAKQRPKSRSRGRRGTPAEVVLRLLVLKHIRNLSYDALEREVRPNLVYRDFTRVGGEKMPDAKSMGRWGLAVGPQVLRQIHDRVVEIAQEKGVVAGRRMRVDTTVVETNIHYPTDSTLLGDGVRVLTRTMKKITHLVGAVGTKLRDRSRSVKLRLFEIARIARAKGPLNRDRLQQRYRRLLDTTSRVVGQAKRFSQEIGAGVKRSVDVLQQIALQGLRAELDRMVPMLRRVMQQARARVFHGDSHFEGKILSVFEPSTEVIRKGKAGKPNEFGKMIKLQEAENQIIVDYEVYARRPHDSDLLSPPTGPSWGACRDWWRPMPGSIPPGMRRQRRRWVSSACAFPTARARARSANASRGSAGFATARNGAPEARDASAW